VVTRNSVSIDLLARVQAAHPWLRVELYPSGGSADYLLLYILSRALVEFRFSRCLEFGSGQTTRLLAQYGQETGASTVTIEHDEFWYETIKSRANRQSHQLIHARLVEYTDALFGKVLWYDEACIRPLIGQPYELAHPG
jgi:hypothetical protein